MSGPETITTAWNGRELVTYHPDTLDRVQAIERPTRGATFLRVTRPDGRGGATFDHEDVACTSCVSVYVWPSRCWTPRYGSVCDRCGRQC